MHRDLYRRAAIQLLITPFYFGALLFLPAGTFDYWEAWVFIVVFFVATVCLTVWLAVTDPELLERRMRAGPRAEQATSQKIIVTIAFICFAGVTVLPALDHRFGWSTMPRAVVVIGNALVALSYLGYFFVFRENTYGGATIRVEEGQKVISTGPYRIVRHPMYTAGLLMFTAIPLALGSWWGLLFALVGLAALAWRIRDEERLLTRELPGYADYIHRVRWRMIPGIY